ncbi:MAG: response regulator [Candidatus Kapaibacteriota bacterium]
MENNKAICIIEDNTPNRKLFALLLAKAGYKVFDFGDGKTALDWFKSNTVDIIIMDILLPDMNGTELIKYVRELPAFKDAIVIAITGFTSPNDREKFIKAGFNGYISKPVNTATFVAEIEAFLQSSK